jgi:hypothetical protein
LAVGLSVLIAAITARKANTVSVTLNIAFVGVTALSGELCYEGPSGQALAKCSAHRQDLFAEKKNQFRTYAQITATAGSQVQLSSEAPLRLVTPCPKISGRL